MCISVSANSNQKFLQINFWWGGPDEYAFIKILTANRVPLFVMLGKISSRHLNCVQYNFTSLTVHPPSWVAHKNNNNLLHIFTTCNSDLMFLMLGNKTIMILISKAFLRIKFDHLTPFSDEKHQLHCSGITNEVLVCLSVIS